MQQAPQFWSPSNKRSGLPDSAHLRLFALGATMELGAAIAQALGHPPWRPMRNANLKMASTNRGRLILSEEWTSMSYKVSTGVLPRVQMTSFAGYCFSLALSKMLEPRA
jgi:hypothetical protein